MIAFRVDANETVATGHLMRCMAAALELQSMGSGCIFYLAEGKFAERLEKHQLPYRILNSEWDNLEAELPVLLEILKKDRPEWLAVDSYQATVPYLHALEQSVKVLYFDDLAKERYPVSAVLHYSCWPENEQYRLQYRGTATAVLAGMQYTPLRREFYPGTGERTRRIMVTTGGTDQYNVAGHLLRAVRENSAFREYTFHVIIGRMNQNKEELEELARGNHSVALYYDAGNMGEIMRGCDYAVSAGGTTLFELCACRLPAVCFSFAENQREFAESMGQRGIMIYAGDARYGVKETVCRIIEGLLRLISDDTAAQGMSERMGKLVDGRGAARIAEFLSGRA